MSPNSETSESPQKKEIFKRKFIRIPVAFVTILGAVLLGKDLFLSKIKPLDKVGSNRDNSGLVRDGDEAIKETEAKKEISVEQAMMDEIFKILEGQSEVYFSKEETDLKTVIDINGVDFFKVLSEKFSPEELEMFFIVGENGELMYPVGLTVNLEIKYEEQKDKDEEKKPVVVSFAIEHLPILSADTSSSAGGHSYGAYPDDDNGSKRNTRVSAQKNGRTKFWYTSFDNKVNGYEVTGGYDPDSNQDFLWGSEFEGGGPFGTQFDLTDPNAVFDFPYPDFGVIIGSLGVFLGE